MMQQELINQVSSILATYVLAQTHLPHQGLNSLTDASISTFAEAGIKITASSERLWDTPAGIVIRLCNGEEFQLIAARTMNRR